MMLGRFVPLSLCIIVKNEKDYLSKCLASAAGLADDLVVVDTGSTDGSQDIARSFSARVIQSTWEDDFSKPRNLSIEHARGRFILWMDADDMLQEPDKKAIRSIVEDPAGAPAAFIFRVINVRNGEPWDQPFSQIRLFPNLPSLRWGGRIHETIHPAILKAGIPIVQRPDINILHTGYVSDGIVLDKRRRNLRIFQKEYFPDRIYESTNMLSDEDVLGREYLMTMARDFLKSGRPYTIELGKDVLRNYPPPHLHEEQEGQPGAVRPT